jgi:hypothetical protein
LHTASLQIRVLTRVVGHFLDLVDPRFDRCPCAVATQSSSGSDRRWGFAYWFSNQTAFSSPFAFGMGVLGTRGLAALLQQERLDFVVSTHPTPAGAFPGSGSDGGRWCPHTLVFRCGLSSMTRSTALPPAVHRETRDECPTRPPGSSEIRRAQCGGDRAATGAPITRRAAEPVPLTSRSRGDRRLTHGLAHCSFRHAGDVGGRRPRVLYAHHPWIDLVGDPGLPVVAQKSPSPVGEALTKCPRSGSGDRKGTA